MSRLGSIFATDSAIASRVTAALVAGMLGLFLLAGVGFAQITHEAAHDSRHSVSFPCH